MIGIVDYGVGNLFSLKSSLNSLNVDCSITADKDKLASCDGIILPGVGAFEDAVNKLKNNGLDIFVKDFVKGGRKILGICLGMQLLFDKSFEYGEHKGLGLIPGDVIPLVNRIGKGYKIPHMGWNSLDIRKSDGILSKINNGDYVYYVHSYYAETDAKYITATSEYGKIDVTASVQSGNVYGTQFHPEKSGKVGLEILEQFVRMCKEQ